MFAVLFRSSKAWSSRCQMIRSIPKQVRPRVEYTTLQFGFSALITFDMFLFNNDSLTVFKRNFARELCTRINLSCGFDHSTFRNAGPACTIDCPAINLNNSWWSNSQRARRDFQSLFHGPLNHSIPCDYTDAFNPTVGAEKFCIPTIRSIVSHLIGLMLTESQTCQHLFQCSWKS